MNNTSRYQRHHYHDDPSEVAMTNIHTSMESSTDVESIFNPLVDAPPTPPPRSYQHSAAPAPSSTIAPSSSRMTTRVWEEQQRGRRSPNYYYSSQGNDFFKSPGIVYELELRQRQEQRQRNRRRALLVIGLLLFFSWRKNRWNRRHRAADVTTDIATTAGIDFEDDEIETNDDNVMFQNSTLLEEISESEAANASVASNPEG